MQYQEGERRPQGISGENVIGISGGLTDLTQAFETEMSRYVSRYPNGIIDGVRMFLSQNRIERSYPEAIEITERQYFRVADVIQSPGIFEEGLELEEYLERQGNLDKSEHYGIRGPFHLTFRLLSIKRREAHPRQHSWQIFLSDYGLEHSVGLHLSGDILEFQMMVHDQFLGIVFDEGDLMAIIGYPRRNLKLATGNEEQWGIGLFHSRPFLATSNYLSYDDDLRFTDGWPPEEHDPEICEQTEEISYGSKIFVNGRYLEFQLADDQLKLLAYRVNDEDVLDYEVAIPLRQELTDYVDKKGRYLRIYRIETDLISEKLRENPFTGPLPDDDGWMKENLEEALGIKVKKNVTKDDTSLDLRAKTAIQIEAPINLQPDEEVQSISPTPANPNLLRRLASRFKRRKF